MPEITQHEHNASNKNKIGNLAGKDLVDVTITKDVKLQGYGSIFSRYNLFKMTRGLQGTVPIGYDESEWADTTWWGSQRRTDYMNPSTNILCSDLRAGAVEYEYSDFAYVADFGEIPNHWMITLRRFGTPIGDNIWSPELFGRSPDVARAIGYMTEEKNKLSDLMGFDVKINYKKLKSSIQSVENSSGYGSNFPKMGQIAKVLGDGSGAKKDRTNGNSNADSFDPMDSNTNKVWGPIDVIDEIQIRDTGLVSEMKYELTFDYELKSIDGVNPRAAMMDLLTNLLLLTYNKGAFWGGATRYKGRKPEKFLFGDPSLLQQGDAFGFLESALGNATKMFENLIGSGGDPKEQVGNMLKKMGGNLANMLGGMALDKMGRPEMMGIQSLLKSDEVGEWHLTVGNPLYPTMVAGNLILTNSKFTFDGPMGVDGFPSKLKLVCSLEPAMSRDRVGIQDMFTYGNGIMKIPLSPEISLTVEEAKAAAAAEEEEAAEAAATGTAAVDATPPTIDPDDPEVQAKAELDKVNTQREGRFGSVFRNDFPATIGTKHKYNT